MGNFQKKGDDAPAYVNCPSGMFFVLVNLTCFENAVFTGE